MKVVTFKDVFNTGKQSQKFRIVSINGRVFIGHFDSRTDAFDNDPEVDTIELRTEDGTYTFPETDIKTIELID